MPPDKFDNVARMRAFVTQVQEQGHLELFDQFVHPDFRDHPVKIGQPNDRFAIRKTLEGFHAAFADIKVQVLHCIENDGVVATNKILSGKLVQEWHGMMPDGGRVEVRVMDFVRFHDGKMIEHWAAVNPLASEV
ncbi:putative Ester cyclase [Seiridium cardinale]|uniref:Ester cyclase n=1 Tax=Seiridium cardinale TaxID=138064 RepID=A0ABR2XMW0_9PEZI